MPVPQRQPSLPPSVSAQISKLTHDVSVSLQKAGSAISTGLRSCDNADSVISAGSELIISGKRAASAAWGASADHSVMGGSKNGATNSAGTLSGTLGKIGAAASASSISKPFYWGNGQFRISVKWSSGSDIITHKQPSKPQSTTLGSEDNHSSSTFSDNTQSPDFGGFVTVSAWTEDAGQKTLLNTKVKWRRKCGGNTLTAIDAEGPRLPITADDIGCYIVAEVTPTSGNLGTRFGEIGPFDLDGAMRVTLQGYIAVGGTSFSVELLEDDVDTTQWDSDDKTLVLSVSTEEMRLTKPGPRNIGYVRDWTASLNCGFSAVSIDLDNLRALSLNFKSKNSSTNKPEKVQVLALSRKQRDVIALTIRAFQAQKILHFGVLLEQVTQNTYAKALGMSDCYNTDSNIELDFFLVFDQLNRHLLSATETASRAVRDLDRAAAERDALEKDINSTIEIYKALLDEATCSPSQNLSPESREISAALIQVQGSDLTQRAALLADLRQQISDLQDQARKYLEESERAKMENQTLRTKLEEKSTQLVEKQNQLRAWLESPDGNTASHKLLDTTTTDSKREMNRLMELEREIRRLEKMNLTLTQRDMDNHTKIENMKTEISQLKFHDEERLSSKHEREMKTLENKIMNIELEKYNLEQDLDYVKEKLKEAEHKERSALVNQSRLNDTIDEVERSSKKELEIYKLKLQDREAEVLDHKKKNAELTVETGKLKSRIKHLETTLDKTKDEMLEKTQKFIDLNKTLLLEQTTRGNRDLALSMTAPSSPVTNGEAGLIDKVKKYQQENERLRLENEELKKKVRRLAMSTKD